MASSNDRRPVDSDARQPTCPGGSGEGDDMSPAAPPTRRDVVVGFADAASSTVALKQATIEVEADETARLVVVHASSAPIAVRNGPSAAVAHAMGEPVWSTVHTTVLALGALPERTLTVIEPGEPLVVLARHGANASVVYLGPTRRRVRRRRSLFHRLDAFLDCPVIQVADHAGRRSRPRNRSRAHRAQASPALQPGATS